MNILFDYPQKEIDKCLKGDLVHSYYLAKYLSRHVNVYGLRPNSPPQKISSEIKTKFFTNFFIHPRTTIVSNMIHFLYALLNHKKIDLLYSRYGYSWKRYGYYFKILTNKKWFIEVGGVPWEEEESIKYSRPIRRLFLYPLTKADRIIFYSPSIKREVLKEIKIEEDKICIFPCGVNADRFVIKNHIPTKEIFRNYEGNFIIAFVGLINRWQGLDVLVMVAEKLKKENINLKFLIVGGGRYLSDFKELVCKHNVKKYFIFTGPVAHRRIVDYINVGNICIAPFAKERKASPIKIFEYMACGKMVISSKIPDVLSLGLDEGIIYFEPENSESLFAAIKRIINNTAQIKKPEEIRKLILEKYTWKKIVKDIYREIRKEVDITTNYEKNS